MVKFWMRDGRKNAPFRQAQGPEPVEGQKVQKREVVILPSFLSLLCLFAAINIGSWRRREKEIWKPGLRCPGFRA
jgi:hypothetical protein